MTLHYQNALLEVNCIDSSATQRIFCAVVFGYLHNAFNSIYFALFQVNSVTQSCPTLCDPMNLSMPGLPVHH